jgi:hypothetical protein
VTEKNAAKHFKTKAAVALFSTLPLQNQLPKNAVSR